METFIEIFNYHRGWILPLLLMLVAYGIFSVFIEWSDTVKKVFDE